MSAEKYYVKRSGKLYGPFTVEKLANCINQEIFTEKDQVSANQLQWESARDFLKTAKSVSTSSPVPGRLTAESVRPTASASAHWEAPQPKMKFDYQENSEYELIKKLKESLNVFNIFAVIAGVGCGVITLLSVFSADLKDYTVLGMFVLMEFAAALLMFIFGFIILHRSWQSIPEGEGRATPGKAVGFLFIPFFNLYWIFIAYYGLALDLNEQWRRNGMGGNVINDGGILTMVILFLCVGFLGNLFWGYLFFWTFLGQLAFFYSLIVSLAGGALRLSIAKNGGNQ